MHYHFSSLQLKGVKEKKNLKPREKRKGKENVSILFLIACLHYIVDIFVTYFVLYRYIHITYVCVCVCVCFSLRKMEIEEIEIEETLFQRILDRKYLY